MKIFGEIFGVLSGFAMFWSIKRMWELNNERYDANGNYINPNTLIFDAIGNYTDGRGRCLYHLDEMGNITYKRLIVKRTPEQQKAVYRAINFTPDGQRREMNPQEAEAICRAVTRRL